MAAIIDEHDNIRFIFFEKVSVRIIIKNNIYVSQIHTHVYLLPHWVIAMFSFKIINHVQNVHIYFKVEPKFPYSDVRNFTSESSSAICNAVHAQVTCH